VPLAPLHDIAPKPSPALFAGLFLAQVRPADGNARPSGRPGAAWSTNTISTLSQRRLTFALAVGVEGFAYAFASIVLITYMSTLASVEHAASQFGLLTSLCAFPGSILAGFSGFVIEHTGFVWFFIWTSLIGIPVALLAVFVWYRVGISDEVPIQIGGGH